MTYISSYYHTFAEAQKVHLIPELILEILVTPECMVPLVHVGLSSFLADLCFLVVLKFSSVAHYCHHHFM